MLNERSSPSIVPAEDVEVYGAAMRAMAEAGMTPYQILESGTRNVGDYFQGKGSFGTGT